MKLAADSRRMQKAAYAPFGSLDPFNLGGIATFNMFPYQAFGGLSSGPIASAFAVSATCEVMRTTDPRRSEYPRR